jgi:peptide/nickel transport system substrate-binding protein
MHKSLAHRGFYLFFRAAAVGGVFSEFLLACWLTAGLAGQEPTQSAAQSRREQPAKKPTGRKLKEEEEAPTKPPLKVPPRVGDEDLEANPPSGTKSGTLPPSDLEREAKRAKHPAVRELFSRLAKPHDEVTLTNKRTWNVEPIPQYFGPGAHLPQSLSLHPVDTTWKRIESFAVSGREISKVEPYEQMALNKVDEFLSSGLDRDAESKQYLSRPEMLQEAEKALQHVLIFHDSAAESGLRRGNGWNGLRKQLVARLQKIQFDELTALTDRKSWEAAFDLATRLSEAYPAQNDQEKIVAQLARFVRQALADKDYELTSRRLTFIEGQFPSSSSVLEPIRSELRSQAAALLSEAKAKAQAGDLPGASARLEKARQIDPTLPELQEFSLRLDKKHPVLYVGVHDLPEYFSPATAYLDSEKQAVELLFESLVRLSSGARIGPHYEPVLASDLPRLEPLGRQFSLVRGAYWSDGNLVTAADVRNTVDLLSRWRGHIPEWAALLKDGARIGRDSSHIQLTLHQGYVDPLSLMDFKILPQSLTAADDPEFAKKPIGSGPYRLLSTSSTEVVFVANPHYEARAGKSGLPLIREIHFMRSANPVEDFHSGHLQLLLDLPTSRYKDLDSAGLSDVEFRSMPNRRIYFLAVNHHRPPLDNKELRRALAHAINREAILNDCFRAGLASPPHRALNGPYPPGSWAYNSALPPDPFNPNLAKAQADQAKTGRSIPRLTLKYPKGDPAVEKACRMIQQQVQGLGAGISLELQALQPRELHRDVEERREYDLAYYSWDYPDESYSLWPLLDPNADYPGGRNFLGYKDGELPPLLINVMGYREPDKIKSLTHKIHEVFYQNMPFIPLWQLDTHVAVHKSLSLIDGQGRPLEIDPLLIFTGVETWTLDKR